MTIQDKNWRTLPRSKNPTYGGVHIWLSKHNMKTGICDFCHSEKTTQWAKKKESEYTRNREDYYELCIPCHRKYDFKEETGKKIGKSNTGNPRPYKWKAITVTKDGFIKKYPAIKDAVKELGLNRHAVSNVLLGRAKTTKDYIITYTV